MFFDKQSEFRITFAPAVVIPIGDIKMAIRGAENFRTEEIKEKECYVEHVGVGLCNVVQKKKSKKKTEKYVNLDPDCHKMIHLPKENMHLVKFEFFGKKNTHHRIRIFLGSSDDQNNRTNIYEYLKTTESKLKNVEMKIADLDEQKEVIIAKLQKLIQKRDALKREMTKTVKKSLDPASIPIVDHVKNTQRQPADVRANRINVCYA